jgi:hypothetical protein
VACLDQTLSSLETTCAATSLQAGRFLNYNGYWYWGRPTMAELHLELRGVFKKIRPDFDLAAPGLREAWDTLEEPIRCTEGKSIGMKR